jgi:hypothetical protein
MVAKLSGAASLRSQITNPDKPFSTIHIPEVIFR